MGSGGMLFIPSVYASFKNSQDLNLLVHRILTMNYRYTPFVVTSCASKVHGASGPDRGKPVLIYTLACSLAFHAITFERSIMTFS